MDEADELANVEQSIQELETDIASNQESIAKYEAMTQSDITAKYIADHRRTIFTLADLLDRLRRKKTRLENTIYHQGKWWKCPSCGTTNPPGRRTCDNCI